MAKRPTPGQRLNCWGGTQIAVLLLLASPHVRQVIVDRRMFMPMPSIRSSLPRLALALVSGAFMLHTLVVHSQSRSEYPATPSDNTSSGVSRSAAGAASSGSEKISRADEKLMSEIAQANLTEISAGKLAQDKSQNEQIKSFAQKMVDDHTKALDELKQLAQAKGITLPTEPDRQQKAMEKRLSSLSGEKFDKQYLDQAGERSHKGTHKLLSQASTKAQDTDLKNYASKTMGVVESHQKLASEAGRNMKSSGQGKSGAGSTGGGTEEQKIK